MARRDLASGRLSVMLGAAVLAVASTVAVGLLVDRVEQALLADSSALLAADLAIASSEPGPARYLAEAARHQLKHARVASLRSVVARGDRLQLVQLKAVSPGYPLRGRLQIADAPGIAVTNVDAGPARGEVWADARLLALLEARIGDEIGIGALTLRLARVLVLEPDRGGELFALAPRALMHFDDLAATGLVLPGSRIAYNLLLAGSARDVRAFRRDFSPEPGHTLLDPQSARPETRAALTQAERFLALAAFAAVALAAIGVTLAALSYAETHESTIALLKTLGLEQRAIAALLAWEMALLAALSAVGGNLLAFGMHHVLLTRLLPAAEVATTAPSPLVFLHGFVVALVALYGFALPALARLAGLPVMEVLARDRAELQPPRWRAVLPVLVALVAIAPWYVGNPRLIALTLAAMTATALVLALCAWLTVRALALMRARTSMSWRFGLANVARRARLSVVQVTAVGLGLAVILLLALVRNDLLSQWRARLPPDTPNQFLINVQGDEREALAQFIRAASGRRVEFYPMVRGRLVAINDAKVIADRYVDQRARRLADREFNLSWATAPKADNRIVAGHWWSPASSGELSVEEGLAKALGLALGDELTFQVAERRLRARITNLRAVDWDNFQVNFFVVATPEWLQDEPATYITSVRVEPTQSRAMTRLVARFPSVTVIDVDALMRQVLQIMDRVVAALTGVFALALAAGGLVLGAAVQASQRTRLHDTVLLKTLGASRRFVRAATLGEFAVLGLVAGLIGSLAALAMGWLLAHQVFDTPYVPDPLIVVGGIAAGMGGFIVVGLLAVGRVMRVPTSVGLRDVG